MMFKHRDTDCLDNRIAYFQGNKYAFIGLMNAPTLDGEVWSGVNEAGFCIMNTASYNLREDSLECQMDREGELMYHALANCATIADFEAWLESYPQPWGVEANFGIIDAQGGAAYFEMNNSRYIKYDVNAEQSGYRVVTNFSFAGRYEDYEGYERYLTASTIMQEAFSCEHEFSATEVLNRFSRQYRHELLGINISPDNVPDYTVDQDFIPRRITSAMIVFEGVKAGNNPLHTIMWTALGYPACAVAIPLLVHGAHLPYYMLARDMHTTQPASLHSEMHLWQSKTNGFFRFTSAMGTAIYPHAMCYAVQRGLHPCCSAPNRWSKLSILNFCRFTSNGSRVLSPTEHSGIPMIKCLIAGCKYTTRFSNPIYQTRNNF